MSMTLSPPFTTLALPHRKRFFQLSGQNLSSGFIYKNNSADFAGSASYGGAIDNCKLTGLDPYSSGEVFMLVYTNDTVCNTTSNMSSDPLRICLCIKATLQIVVRVRMSHARYYDVSSFCGCSWTKRWNSYQHSEECSDNHLNKLPSS